jgi:hypothetical protein
MATQLYGHDAMPEGQSGLFAWLVARLRVHRPTWGTPNTR